MLYWHTGIENGNCYLGFMGLKTGKGLDELINGSMKWST